jgi:hypothetical protein
MFGKMRKSLGSKRKYMRPKDIEHICHLVGISHGRNVFDESVNGALLRDVFFHVSWWFDNRREWLMWVSRHV